ncbi:hypothetical protein TSUD_57170 [Trifolium subterraneum]|uniref:Peptidase A1 domain-containing protein n=1 Tax=Trifolium subterraneum TaxID=3900 RepID=A0A2Z6MSG4_TRISU|nr:hypothetical protein TSUD_57170 [Trifolium subterraneum]
MVAAVILFTVTVLSAAAISSSHVTLTLERAFPTNHGVELSYLKALDSFRHQRFLQSTNYVVDFPVKGSFDTSKAGLYFTKVNLGTPPREFYVQIDTGSDVLWVSCASCNGCPQTSSLQIQLNYFDPQSSSTSSFISCSDQSCSNQQSGDLTKSDRAIDGIFGFGQQGMSVISQLSSQGIAPRVFSHCLKGDSSGGGLLVLGEIVEPNIIYSPLVPSQPHYNLNLLSISVNGQNLPIDSAIFATSNNRGTIIDSGTTLAYIAEEAYNPFINAITAAIPQSVRTVLSRGNQCYLVTTSLDVFPQVSLNFAGGASLVLGPQDYLIKQNYIGDGSVWCIGFQKIPGQDVTILGDLVLKDRIFVYDLAGQRIGWANYDCSLSVNVSASAGNGRSEFVNAGDLSGSTSLRDGSHSM